MMFSIPWISKHQRFIFYLILVEKKEKEQIPEVAASSHFKVQLSEWMII